MKPVCSAIPMKSSGAIAPRWRVAPADERLGAAHAVAAQVDLRLELRDDLAVVERAPQVARERQPDEVVRVLLARVALDARAARLRLVHRDVGALHQRLDVAAVLGVGRHADAEADVEPHAGDVERLAERAAHAVGDQERGVGVLARQQDGELVAAEPGDRGAERDPPLEPQADLLEHLVAVVVAERVVDLLEAVEVDQQQRDPRVHVRGRDALLEALVEARAVRQAGERVVHREVLGDLGLARGALHGQQREHDQRQQDEVALERDDRERREADEHALRRRLADQVAGERVLEPGAAGERDRDRDGARVEGEEDRAGDEHADQLHRPDVARCAGRPR